MESVFNRYFISTKRKHFKRNFALCLIIYLLFTIIQFASNSHPNSFTAITNTGLMSLVNILMSYFFGYLWLLISFFPFLLTLLARFRSFYAIGSPLFFNNITIQTCIWIASILISILSERDMRIRAKNEWLSVRDGLTGLYNYRYFSSRLDEEIQKIRKKGDGCLSVCFIDIDNFKAFNDHHGHSKGDEILHLASTILLESARKTDIVCRYGGDEFAIIMPGAQENDVITVIGDINSNLKYSLDLHKFQNVHFSLSMGFSIYPKLANDKETLFEQADAALYKAKNSGRNTYRMYQDIITEIAKDVSDYQQLTEIIKVLLRTISDKDQYTCGHSERVAEFVVLIGKALKLPEEEIRVLEIEGLLHDIGKLKIPNGILNKKEPLSKEEFDLIRMHPVYSASIIHSLAVLYNFERDIRHHHERFDGKGYPDALSGCKIPLGARILAVADAFDAMRSDRPYRKSSLSLEKAEKELTDNAGSQFDPQVVHAFLTQLEKRYTEDKKPDRFG